MSRPNGLQEATALNDFGYYVEPVTGIQRAYLGNCNGIGLQNIIKDRTLIKEISSIEILALNTTPIEIIPAPGVGFMVIPKRIALRHGDGTAYTVDPDADLVLKYSNSSGVQCSQLIETTGFLDSATTALITAGQVIESMLPKANAPVVLHCLKANPTGGDFAVDLIVEYDIYPAGN